MITIISDLSEVLNIGNNEITGYGVALFISLSFNFLLFYALRDVHNKFIEHLQKSDELLSKIHITLIKQK